MAKTKKVPKASSKPKAGLQAETNNIVDKVEVEPQAEESTTLDTLYIITDSGEEVTLEVNVNGEGQTSDMTVKLDADVIVKEHAGDLGRRVVGTNKKLNGRKLSLAAVITDTSRKTNFTGLTIRLAGGVIPVGFPLFKTVDEEGQSAEYLCLIEFFKP